MTLPDKKILVKGGPKQYKTRAGLSGSPRLYRQLLRMRASANRAAQRPDADPFTIALSDELNRAVMTLERERTAQPVDALEPIDIDVSAPDDELINTAWDSQKDNHEE